MSPWSYSITGVRNFINRVNKSDFIDKTISYALALLAKSIDWILLNLLIQFRTPVVNQPDARLSPQIAEAL